MADCCNPVTPPTCINKCQQNYDACCVIDEQPLPCIFPPIETTGSGIITQFVITVDDVTGIEVGMLATGDGIGVGAVVVSVVGLVVTLSVANIATFPAASAGDGVAFLLIDNTQCDINKAVNDAICDLQEGVIPCPEWNDVTLVDPLMELVWTSNSPTQYADPLNCVVRLRGVMETTIPVPLFTAVVSQLYVIPAGPSRPAIQKVLSANIVVNSDDEFTALYVPGFVIVNTTGEVQIGFTNFNPIVARLSTCPDCPGGDNVAKAEAYFANATTLTFFITLDGLTFETQA